MYYSSNSGDSEPTGVSAEWTTNGLQDHEGWPGLTSGYGVRWRVLPETQSHQPTDSRCAATRVIAWLIAAIEPVPAFQASSVTLQALDFDRGSHSRKTRLLMLEAEANESTTPLNIRIPQANSFSVAAEVHFVPSTKTTPIDLMCLESTAGCPTYSSSASSSHRMQVQSSLKLNWENQAKRPPLGPGLESPLYKRGNFSKVAQLLFLTCLVYATTASMLPNYVAKLHVQAASTHCVFS